jgi:hypothetical protein
MDGRLRKPDRRTCELCGRSERWDDGEGAWRVRAADGERLTGGVHCIHQWDIDGTFSPIEELPGEELAGET